MTTRVRSFAALAAFMGFVGSAALMTASAANLAFLDKSPVSYFTPEDMELMRSNATKALDDASGGTSKQSWSNTKTGASGWAQVRGQFTTSDGTPCKRLRIVNKAKGLTSDATYTVCKHPERGWAMNADAEPSK